MNHSDGARDRHADLHEIQCIVARAEHMGFAPQRVATALGVSPRELAEHLKHDDARAPSASEAAGPFTGRLARPT